MVKAPTWENRNGPSGKAVRASSYFRRSERIWIAPNVFCVPFLACKGWAETYGTLEKSKAFRQSVFLVEAFEASQVLVIRQRFTVFTFNDQCSGPLDLCWARTAAAGRPQAGLEV
jgi:hypothetical protein